MRMKEDVTMLDDDDGPDEEENDEEMKEVSSEDVNVEDERNEAAVEVVEE